MSASHEEQQTTHHPTFMQYVLVAVILFAITIVEFVLIWDKAGIDDDLGASKIPLLIGLSAVKFGIVIMFYMHLKFESRLFTYIFLAGLALAFAAGLAVLGIFVALEGEPREFAKANAVPYVEEGHESEGEPTSESTGPINLTIGAKGDTLEFDTSKFTAPAGSEVVLSFNNGSAINQHNWVLVQLGTKDAVAADGSLAGPANDWIPPNDDRIFAQTSLLDPGESEEIRFTLDLGTYQFVCTFPAHNFTMFGDFEATEAASPVIVESTGTSTGEPVGATGLQINVQGDALEFDASSLSATAGSEVELTFSNGSALFEHNWVLVRPGTKDAVATRGTANPTTGWIQPDDPDVIANTKLVSAGQTGTISFTAPAAGTYQFVCTFPGHNGTMFGDFEVTQPTSGQQSNPDGSTESINVRLNIPGDSLEFDTSSFSPSNGSEAELTFLLRRFPSVGRTGQCAEGCHGILGVGEQEGVQRFQGIVGPYDIRVESAQSNESLLQTLFTVYVLEESTGRPIADARVLLSTEQEDKQPEERARANLRPIHGFIERIRSATALNAPQAPEQYDAYLTLDAPGVWRVTVEVGTPFGTGYRIPGELVVGPSSSLVTA